MLPKEDLAIIIDPNETKHPKNTLFLFFNKLMTHPHDLTDIMAPPPGEALSHIPLDSSNKKRKERERSKSPQSSRKKSRHRHRDTGRERREATDEEEQMMMRMMLEQDPNKVDPKARRSLIKTIKNWKAAFPEPLEDMLDNYNLEEMEIKQLEDLLTEIRLEVGLHNSGSIADWAPATMLNVTENVLKQYGMKVDGLTGLSREEAFRNACKEAALDFDVLTYIPPLYRIPLMVANKAITLHEENTAIENAQKSQTGGSSAPMMEPMGRNYTESEQQAMLAEMGSWRPSEKGKERV
jgi:hypothetical protein